MSIGADVTRRLTVEGGTGFRCRLRHTCMTAVVGTALGALLLAGCSSPRGASPAPSAGSGAASTTASATAPDSASAQACTAFYGDPEYRSGAARDVLVSLGATSVGAPDDPTLLGMTADDVDSTFDKAGGRIGESGRALAEVLRKAGAAGGTLDADGAQRAWKAVATACAPASVAAAFAAGVAAPHSKPAALSCSAIVDTPQSLTALRSPNVLSAQALDAAAGKGPRQRRVDVSSLLATEVDAAKDPAVKSAIGALRSAVDATSYADATKALGTLGEACTWAGYPIDGTGGQG